MTARWLAFAIWALVAATAVFWGSRLFVASPSAPAHARAADDGRAPPADVLRVLGRAPVVAVPTAPVVPADSRFKLVGVAAPRAVGSAGGVALIAVDGKPARAFRVGTAIEPDLVLLSVQQRAALLGTRGEPPRVRLELPALPPPATGSLSATLSNDGSFGAPVLPNVPSAGLQPTPLPLPRPSFSPAPGATVPPPIALPGAGQAPPGAVPGLVPGEVQGEPPQTN